MKTQEKNKRYKTLFITGWKPGLYVNSMLLDPVPHSQYGSCPVQLKECGSGSTTLVRVVYFNYIWELDLA
jgi:hypothetical protein